MKRRTLSPLLPHERAVVHFAYRALQAATAVVSDPHLRNSLRGAQLEAERSLYPESALTRTQRRATMRKEEG